MVGLPVGRLSRGWGELGPAEGSGKLRDGGHCWVDSHGQEGATLNMQSGLDDILPPTPWWQVGGRELGMCVGRPCEQAAR